MMNHYRTIITRYNVFNGVHSCKFTIPVTSNCVVNFTNHARSAHSFPNQPSESTQEDIITEFPSRSRRGLTLAVLSAGFTLAVGILAYEKHRRTKKENRTVGTASSSFRLWPSSLLALEDSQIIPGKLKPGLPTYTLEEVSKHVTKDTGIWVIYKNGVYDITDYVKLHPGGNIILMSAGKAMEPFWEKHSMHYNDVVYEMLEYFRIGNVTEVTTEKEKPDSEIKSWMMPERKCLEMAVGKSRSISMENLTKDFPKKTVVTAVKCSSSETEKKEMKWSGVALGDLIRAQDVDLDNVEHKFLVFESLQKKPDNTPHASLFPVEMARSLKEDILIAYEVNDEPIPPLQGHPFRVIVKGHGGSKQVKWLHRIRFSTKEEDTTR